MQWQYGMSVYFLNQFYRAVEKHAVSSGEWSRYNLRPSYLHTLMNIMNTHMNMNKGFV